MPSRDVVVVVASAGGVEALRQLVAGLPADLPASVLVVLHVPAHGRSHLAAILDRAGPLPVRQAVDGEHLEHGVVLVAAPDHHLALLDDHRVRLTLGPRENGLRPAGDVLFRSAALRYGPRVVGVVLSGVLDDGTSGAVAISRQGGLVAVQDPDDAVYDGMPESVLAHLTPDHVGPAATLGAWLASVVTGSVAGWTEVSDLMEAEVAVQDLRSSAMDEPDRPGTPAGFSCPDCHGTLFQIDDGTTRYRCRVGHAWSPQSLLAQQDVALEGALWTALRGLEEKAALARQMAVGATRRGAGSTAERFDASAHDSVHAASLLRSMLENRPTSPTETATDPLPASDPASDAESGDDALSASVSSTL